MEPLRKDDKYTYGDYKTWDDDERWELIDGVAYAMSPAPSVHHQKLVNYMVLQLGNFLTGKPCQVFDSPIDVRFEEADEAGTVVQPDILVICDPTKIRYECIVGAPDLIVEVLSPSTAARDTIEKMRLYQREGVPEYWVVAPEEKAVYLHILEGGQYTAAKYKDGAVSSVRLAGFSLDVGDLFASLEGLPVR